ncbi:MAG: prolyl oligopeptidase family serine peptidase [Verrucomicrobia subdivision 3 bacterium]|nr:prolyl oligopeptidase family serine peptidase [Limisphaerales bacterium]
MSTMHSPFTLAATTDFMKAFVPLVAVMCLSGCISDQPKTTAPAVPLAYPGTAKIDHVDDYHGTKVADPYRWLEDDYAPDTKAWVQAQNKVTFAYLEKIPARERIKNRLTELWNYERYGVPFRDGGRYFITRNDGLQNQSVLYTMKNLEEVPAMLLDPNTFSADGTIALAGHSVTEDGSLLAYGTSTAGSDWEDWKVRNINSGKDLADEIKWVKTSLASWTKDGKGFFYSRYDEPAATNKFKGVNYFHKLYYHRLGTPQSEDVLVYHRPDQKEWGFFGAVTDDGRYLAMTVWHGTDTRNRFFYKDLESPNNPVVELLNDFDADYTFIDNVDSTFYFRTDLDAPRGRLIAIDIKNPSRANWREVVPQGPDRLRGASLVNHQFIATYLKDAHSQVKIYDLTGSLVRTVQLPGIGSVTGFGGKRHETETFYAFTSFTRPTTIYRYDLRTGTSAVFREPKVKFNPEDFESRQVFYTSKDGTRVPMFIVSKRGLKLNGANPLCLYGYGGFDISLTPSFSVSTLAWLEMGGVYAQPNLRGGGEYGKEWHQAGTKLKKQNVFDDFIAAAEWLIANQYTSSEKLAIAGGSNGGLLVGACMTQRPDLFRVALPAVGVMDMLRFHKFTRGWAWTSDYGSPDSPEEFKALYTYSPLHNLKPGTKYPSTLVTTADHDDRVVPAHSFKFAAALQAAHSGESPVLIRIETKAGHGAGKPTSKIIEEAADRWAFAVQELGMDQRAKTLRERDDDLH